MKSEIALTLVFTSVLIRALKILTQILNSCKILQDQATYSQVPTPSRILFLGPVLRFLKKKMSHVEIGYFSGNLICKISGHPTGFFFPNQTLVPFQSTNGPIKSDARAPLLALRAQNKVLKCLKWLLLFGSPWYCMPLVSNLYVVMS